MSDPRSRAMIFLFALGASVFAGQIHAQPTTVPLQLVRCGPQLRAACVSIRLLMADRAQTAVFGVPTLPLSSLARAPLLRTLAVQRGSATIARVNVSWHPPFFGAPIAYGVADSLTMSEALREALATGVDPAGVRSVIALLLAFVSLMLIVGIPRVLWFEQRETEEDLARQLAAARAVLSTQELEQWRGKAPQQGSPRHPEEPTRESGRSS